MLKTAFAASRAMLWPLNWSDGTRVPAMCLILPCRVCALDGDQAEIELPDGARAHVSAALAPQVTISAYVLVDRGIMIKVIDETEATAILEMYREMDQLLEAEDALR